jgi:hypothetical protein
MRLFLMAVGLWALSGCARREAAEAAIRVEIFYATFQPGCLSVAAADAADPSRSQTVRLLVEPLRSDTKTVAVFRQPDWGRELVVTASANEGSCDGPVVATSTQRVSVPEQGATTAYLDLRAEDLDGDGFVSRQNGGTDCDDADASVGNTLRYYVDNDGDGYGGQEKQTDTTCVLPAGAVSRGGDCNDGDIAFHPGAVDALCDGQDTDCDGKAESAPTPWYSDRDGDGLFGTLEPAACTQPPATQASQNDCDDTARFIGGAEVCDRLDNDCDGTADPAGVCTTTQWTSRVVSAGVSWSAVTAYQPQKAWLVASGKLVHVQGTTDTDRSSACGADAWTVAWARPSDGRLFVAASGKLATLPVSGGTCTQLSTSTSPNALQGFQNGDVTTLYAVYSNGRSDRWEWRDSTGAFTPLTAPPQVAANLKGLHGQGPQALFAVGAEDYNVLDGPKPRVFRYAPATNTWNLEALPALSETGYLRAVSGVDQRAYAVGDSGLVLELREGTWRKLPAPSGTTTVRDVVAFHASAVLALADKDVYVFNGTAWSKTFTFPSGTPSSLEGVVPTEQWATGSQGVLVRWGPTP